MSAEATQNARASENITNTEVQADTVSTHISTEAQKEAAKHSAAAAVASAKSRASARTFGAIAEGISGVAGGGIAAYGRANNLGKYAKP